jgi:hypothetical protein
VALRAEEDIAELPVISASSFEGKPAPPPWKALGVSTAANLEWFGMKPASVRACECTGSRTYRPPGRGALRGNTAILREERHEDRAHQG